MKRLVPFLLALLMTALLLPAAGTAADAGNSVAYTGAEVNAKGLAVGDSFYWTFAISEGSRLWGAQWLIDHPEQYLTPAAVSTTWTGGLQYAVAAAWDDGSAYSDKPEFAYNTVYEGMTGSVPVGEEGNLYTNIVMYLMSFHFGGLMAGGDAVRITYTINALPFAADACHDEGGYYIEIPIVVQDSVYWPEGMTAEGAGNANLQHEQIDSVPGKVYLTPCDAQTAVYRGGTADAASLAVGDTFSVAYSVDFSSGHNFISGLVYIDYPEEYLTPVDHYSPWDGFITDFFGEGADVIPVELQYDLEGNMTTRVDLYYPYVVSDGTLETPSGDDFIIITYRIDSLPEYDSLPADDIGAYLEIPMISQNSMYTTSYYQGTLLWYDSELTFPAMVYMPEPHTFYTVSFYGFGGELIAAVETEQGMAAEAPAVPDRVESNGLTYLFIRWEEDFSEITADTEVHALYLALGDVDGSGSLTFLDITALYQYVAGLGDLPDEYQCLDDVNGDGAVSFVDVADLYALILGQG